METKKSIRADLERKKQLFLQFGLILSLSLALVAFEWRSPAAQKILLTSGISVTEDDFTEIRIPEPPLPKPAPPAFTGFEIVDNNTSVTEVLTIDAGIGEQDSIPEYRPVVVSPLPDEGRVEETELVLIPEKMPEFPGGEEALFEFLGKNIVFPPTAKAMNITGKVYLGFIVEKDGSVSNITVLRPIGGGCEEEAVRVLKMMPKWIPGYQSVNPVRVRFNIPIEFKLVNL